MYIKFQPGNNVDAKLIGMIQSVRSVKKGGTAHYLNKTIKSRSIQSGDAESTSSPVLNTDEGVHIDQFSTNRNPLYAVDVVPNTDTELSQGSTPAPVTKMTKAELAASPVTGKNYKGWGEHGYRYLDCSGLHKKDAELHDAPKIPDRGTNAEQLFETTALAVKGTQEDTYYGSVEWGWRTDAKGNFSRIPFKAISQGAPTSTFFKAAQIWNTTKTAGGAATLDIPIIDVKLVMPGGADIFNDTGDLVSFIPVNTRVQVNDRSHEHVAPGDGSLQHTVLRGDTLWDLAEHYYGDGRRYREIFRANRDQIRDPDLIYPGQELTIPNAVSVDPLAGKVQISIVDGLFTGLGGWVNASCLADERN
jgi:nucleoid-associated protein YgaU